MSYRISPTALIETHFGNIRDPRASHSIEHKLLDILIISICGTISGANDFAAIAEYGKSKENWLKTFLELENGIPSADTFERIFARLKPIELQKCFIGWMEAVHKITDGELLNIDGKTLRGAKEAGNSRSLIHMVSVWSATQHLVLGQKQVHEKSNEITVISPLLEMLAIRGCLVSIDAMGCQKEIAKTIIEQGGDYVLALKGNQGNLYDDVRQLFTSARVQEFHNIEHQFHSTIEKGHGRIEKRAYWTMGNTEFLIGAEKWTGLKSIGMVESERNVQGVVSIEQRYYILSIDSDVYRFSQAVRSHWSIENQLHWILDVAFDEDASQCCRGYSAENLAVIRHVGLNLLSRDKKTKVGVKTKRLKAGWDDNYLKDILAALNIVSL
ncbi:ISAs1 family transposase [Pseudanabaena sp. FACHB-1998]|uniref:ISAs1 family transposase n=1 Tax=Pseudanabaena sp. FACHB-1998 TaxID=2692858 RepID=UPI0016802160|nr:ISAs1 family transposase [Pseudanabaena sp. FACHB-1998]MBD2178891.1 ISAs1 family transposase [Pseudanabaena sp. FACHB-1998]